MMKTKMLQPIFLIFICLLAAFLLTGCQSAGGEKPQERDGEEKLIAVGLESAGRLKEWTCSEAFNAMLGYSRDHAGQEMYEAVEMQDVSAAKAIYSVDFNTWVLFNMNQSGTTQKMSASMKKFITDRMYKSFSSMINGKSGIQALTFSSMYFDEKSFIYKTLEENRVYVYVFESGYPLYVAFIAGEDDIVTAYAQWLVMDCRDITSAEDLEKELNEEGIKISKVK